MKYCVARGTDLGPVGMDFGKTCDDIDRADVVLSQLRERVRQRHGLLEPTWPDTDGPQVIALAHRDPWDRTVSLIMDTATANITMYAVAAYAADREAHVARSNSPAKSCQRTPTADATAKPSPPAKPA